MKKVIYSRDQFDYSDPQNQEIVRLDKQLAAINRMKKRTEDRINEIQDNCEHHYMFCSQGMYEDAYTCKICGHVDWH